MFVQIDQLQWSKAINTQQGLGGPKFDRVKGFVQPLGLKNALLRGSGETW